MHSIFPVSTFQCTILLQVASFQCILFFQVATFQWTARNRNFVICLIWSGKVPWIWIKQQNELFHIWKINWLWPWQDPFKKHMTHDFSKLEHAHIFAEIAMQKAHQSALMISYIIPHKLSLKHHWNFLRTSLKAHWKTLESSLKHPWNFLETFLKLSWKFLETPSKLFWNTVETFTKLSWNFVKTSLKLPWNTLETSSKHLETSYPLWA